MENKDKDKNKKKKFRIEKHELDNHEISPLLVGEDMSNIDYVDIEVLSFAIVMNVKYINNVFDKDKDKEHNVGNGKWGETKERIALPDIDEKRVLSDIDESINKKTIGKDIEL